MKIEKHDFAMKPEWNNNYTRDIRWIQLNDDKINYSLS